MSLLTILHIKHPTALHKYALEKCIWQYLKGHIRIYCVGSKHCQNSGTSKNEGSIKKPALRTRILQDIKRTRQRVEERIERENIWTIPNFLCLGRIITSPFLGYIIMSHNYQVALCLLALAGLSDLADGWIARTWVSQASKLGSFLDPVADKLLVGSLFFSLTWVHLIPVPLTCLVISRDVTLVAAASYIRYQSLPPPKTLARYFDPTHATVQLAPTFISKINTGVQLSLVAGTLAAPVFHFVHHPVLQILSYVTALTTLAGGISYLISKDTYKILTKKKISTRS